MPLTPSATTANDPAELAALGELAVAPVDENLTGRENLRLIGRLTHQPRSAIAARSEELLSPYRR